MVGENIKRIRISRGLLQRELGEMVGVSHNTVSSWESNRTEPHMGMIEKIAKALDCTKSEIAGCDSSKNIDEEILIRMFRSLSDDGKKNILEYLEYIKSKEKNSLKKDLGSYEKA